MPFITDDDWKTFFKSTFNMRKIFTRERFSDPISASILIFFRFVAVWGIGITAFASPNGHDLARFIQNNGTVAATPYAYSAHWSLETIWYLTVWEFCWQFVAAALQMCLPIHMIYVLVDVLCLGGISAGWSQSIRYIPGNDTCTANASAWLAPADGGLNLFAAIGQVANRSATDVCYTFTDVEETQKVTLVMIAIIIALAVWLLLPPEHPLSIPHICVYILLPIGWFFRELVIHLSFLVHYLSHKIWKRDPNDRPVKLKNYMTGLTPLPPRANVQISQSNVERILGIEHMLETICRDLCYKDVVNLSRTSRGVHDLIVPPGDLSIRVEKLRLWTCGGGERQRGACFACNRRVCTECDRGTSFKHKDLAHATRCKPACTWCYYKNIIRNRAQVTGRRTCSGHANDTYQTPHYFCDICLQGFRSRKDIEDEDRNGRRNRAPNRTLNRTSKPVKEAKNNKQGVDEKIHARMMSIALADAQQQNCRFCDSKFTWIRRRWWHCGKCSKECRSAIHPEHLSRNKREPLRDFV